MKTKFALALTAVLALAVGSIRAADTTITIPGLECNGCAKRIVAALTPIAGVAEVKTDVQTHTAIVKPKPNMVLSPKAMWEALEKVNKKPSKLEGPNGTFTEKPQN